MEQFRWSFEFGDTISKKKFEILFKFSCEFNELYDKVIPYHIFLMDLVLAGMKETAHSRFLWKILSYKEADGTYPILESFCNKLLGFKLTVKNPIIEREKGNIDISVRDDDYFLIIENKRHNAQDQPNQLARYINYVNKKQPDLKKIYICYLPGDGKKELNESSWQNPQDPQDDKPYKYEREFEGRFKVVSFKNELLDWLNDLEICNKNLFLQTTLKQYAHLIKRNI